MRRIVRAMGTWNPGMWAGLTGMSALLGAGANTLWISMPAYAALIFLCVMAVAVTFDEATQ